MEVALVKKSIAIMLVILFLLGGNFVAWAEEDDEDEEIDRYKAEIVEKKAGEAVRPAVEKAEPTPPQTREKSIYVIENKVFKNARSNASNDIYRLCIGNLEFVNVVGSGYGRSSTVYTEIVQVIDVNGMPKPCKLGDK